MSNQNKENDRADTNKEIVNLPTISIDFPIEIKGKYFTHNNATDFRGSHSEPMDTLDLIYSPWSKMHIYDGKPSQPEKAISGHHLQTCAFTNAFSHNYYFVNIEWFTEGDWAKQIGKDPAGFRKFPQVELRHIDNPQNNIEEILENGYPLFSELANTKNIITVSTGAGLVTIERNPMTGSTPDQQYFSMAFITDQDGKAITPQQRILSITDTGYRILNENETAMISNPTRNLTNQKFNGHYGFTGSDERVTLGQNGDVLWNYPNIVQNENFQIALGTAFRELRKGNQIIILKKDSNDTRWPVLIAQALNQMLLRDNGSLISWSTQFKAFSKSTRNHHEHGINLIEFELSFATRDDLNELKVDDNRLIIDLNLNGLI